MTRCDVLVAGGGPAGSLAALELVRAGFRVVIADRPGQTGSKQSSRRVGESFPGIGLRLLRSLGIDDSDFGTIHRKISGNLTCWAADELEATDFFRDPDGPGWRLSRRRSDASLLRAATEAGAELLECSVDEVTGTPGGWETRLGLGDTVKSRWLVDATGRGAAVSRKLGVHRIRDEGLVALVGFGSPKPGTRFDRTLIEAVPEGWWYAAVLPDDEAVLMLHVLPQIARAGQRDWLEMLARASVVSEYFPGTGFSGDVAVAEASGSRLENFYGERWIACGDAAMAFDPLSSQGIYTAMYSGLAAARSIAATERGDTSALAAYANRLEEIRRVYRARLLTIYGSVRRWPDSSFWAVRNSMKLDEFRKAT